MSQPHLSLLSLSMAAANAAPVSAFPAAESASRPSQGASTNTTKHRRLSSAGRSRRRLSDARDAATRPFQTSLQSTSASLAALSLSSPTVSQRPVLGGAQPVQVPRAISSKGMSELEPGSMDDTSSPSHTQLPSNSINVVKSGRKRGTIFTCESCSKVYRHPSCLIKHRWEHTPQWREASKFVLSKHQQVQLLEAAAILSHLSPSSASLPEDRSLWPSFLSGGLVPPPALVLNSDAGLTPTTATAISQRESAHSVHTSFPLSSSVPATTMLNSDCLGSAGPWLHDYALGAGATQVRPGTLSAPAAMMDEKSAPVPMTVQMLGQSSTEDDALNLLALRSGTSVPLSSSLSPHSHARSHSHSVSYSRSHAHAHSHSLSLSDAPSKEGERRRSNAYEYGFASGSGAGSGLELGYDHKSNSFGYAHPPNSNSGWSLPRSSLRSKSGSSRSRSQSQSASESRSEDEDEAAFRADPEDESEGGMEGGRTRLERAYALRMRRWQAEDGDDGDSGIAGISLREDAQEGAEDDKGMRMGTEQLWDGMEMEMEMN